MTASRKVEAARNAWAEAARNAWAEEHPDRDRAEEHPDRAVSPEDRIARALHASADGMTLTEVRQTVLGCSKDRTEEALASIRRAQWVTESREPRPNRVGRLQSQVVLRVLGADVGNTWARGGD